MAGRKFEPTEAERTLVQALVAYGADHDGIILELFNGRPKLAPLRKLGPGVDKPITAKTLTRAFGVELALGLQLGNNRVSESLFKRAVDLKHPQGAICAMFWMKTRAGWRELPTKVQHEGAVALNLEGATAEELAVLEKVLARQAAALGQPPANDAEAA